MNARCTAIFLVAGLACVAAVPVEVTPATNPTAVTAADATSILDAIPLLSQLKSITQLVAGDYDGADRTFSNFLKNGLGSSQLRSVGLLLRGEVAKAVDEQKAFLGHVGNAIDAVPILGHLKGAVHMAAGDQEHGRRALMMASSTLGALLGGAVAGPEGFAPGQAVADGLITLANKTLQVVAGVGAQNGSRKDVVVVVH